MARCSTPATVYWAFYLELFQSHAGVLRLCSQMFSHFQANRHSNLGRCAWLLWKEQVSLSDAFTDNVAAGFVHTGGSNVYVCDGTMQIKMFSPVGKIFFCVCVCVALISYHHGNKFIS